jgi:hypothetical protein
MCAVGQKSPGGHSSQTALSPQKGEYWPGLQLTQELFWREKKHPAQQPQEPQSQETGAEEVMGGGEGGAGVGEGGGRLVMGGEEVT